MSLQRHPFGTISCRYFGEAKQPLLTYAAVEAIWPNKPVLCCCCPAPAEAPGFWALPDGYAAVLDGRLGCCCVGAVGRLGATAGRAGAVRR